MPAMGGQSQSTDLGTVVRTRPLFPYPFPATYTGSGSGDETGNVVPVMPAAPAHDDDWAGREMFTRSAA